VRLKSFARRPRRSQAQLAEIKPFARRPAGSHAQLAASCESLCAPPKVFIYETKFKYNESYKIL
jgi:hypothetical protein